MYIRSKRVKAELIKALVKEETRIHSVRHRGDKHSIIVLRKLVRTLFGDAGLASVKSQVRKELCDD